MYNSISNENKRQIGGDQENIFDNVKEGENHEDKIRKKDMKAALERL